MWQVTDKLLLGHDRDAQDCLAMQAAKVTHVVNCAIELPCYFPGYFQYLHLAFKDPDYEFGSKISIACEFLDEATRDGIALVHCQGAISRSPSIVLAYLCHQGYSLEAAIEKLDRVVRTKPNDVFLAAIAAHFGKRESIGQG